MNYAAVLLMQAVIRHAVRDKGAGRVRVQFADVRRACAGVRELHFLAPLDSTLDASALTMRSDAPAPGLDLGEGAGPAEAEPKGAPGGGARAAQGGGARGAPRAAKAPEPKP